MATIDLGKIKFVNRGTYNNGTAYVADDVVQYTDTVGGLQNTSSYIATASTTGNAPASGGTVHGSWSVLAQGAPDRLPSQSGQSGKFLTTNGSALSFGTIPEADWVKINASGATSGISLTISGHYDSTKYVAYKMIFTNLYASSSTGEIMGRFIDTSGSEISNSIYFGITMDAGVAIADNHYHQSNKSNGYNHIKLHDAMTGGGSSYPSQLEFTFYNPHKTDAYPSCKWYGSWWDGTDWIEMEFGSFWYRNSQATGGFRIFNNNSVTMYTENMVIYGLKK
tara:strand:- start:1009 stop:1848 length:840 start_codon:yes stop_codon:yes gene_type:complete